MKFIWYTFIIVIAGIGVYYFDRALPEFPTSLTVDARTPSSTRQPAKTQECKYNSADLAKPIIGYGSTIHEARADASQKCFDVRMHAVEANNTQGSEYYNRGLINIDECVNIRCT